MNILNINKQDWKHISWLFRNMVKQFCIGNVEGVKESWMWIRIHCLYKSRKMY